MTVALQQKVAKPFDRDAILRIEVTADPVEVFSLFDNPVTIFARIENAPLDLIVDRLRSFGGGNRLGLRCDIHVREAGNQKRAHPRRPPGCGGSGWLKQQ